MKQSRIRSTPTKPRCLSRKKGPANQVRAIRSAAAALTRIIEETDDPSLVAGTMAGFAEFLRMFMVGVRWYDAKQPMNRLAAILEHGGSGEHVPFMLGYTGARDYDDSSAGI